MGYTHYWYRDKEIKPGTYRAIVDDFRKLLPIFDRQHVRLCDGVGVGEPIIDYDDVRFNGDSHCGHPANTELVIPWPTERGAGVAKPGEQAIAGEWFAGAMVDKRCCDGDCSYETFHFPRVLTGQEPPAYHRNQLTGKIFSCCKTAFRPYDWAVTTLLIIAKHHLKSRIIVRSDGELPNWHDAMQICQLELDYGLDFQLDKS